MKSKSLKIGILYLIIIFLLFSCNNYSTVETIERHETGIVETESTIYESESSAEEYEDFNDTMTTKLTLYNDKVKAINYDVLDLESIYDDYAAIKVDIGNENSISEEEKKLVKFIDGNIELETGGIYVLKGDLTDGKIIIKKGLGDRIQIVLDNVNIKSKYPNIIDSQDDTKVLIRLSDSSENNLISETKTKTQNSKNSESVISVNGDLSFNGNGILNINSNNQNGIECKGNLYFIAGNYNIETGKSGVRAKDSIIIKNGIYNINSKDDAVKATKDDSGFIYIENGDIDITSLGKCLEAEQEMIIAGGKINLDSEDEAIEGKTVDVLDGVLNIKSNDDGINATDKLNDKKDNQEGTYIRFAGGKVNIDAWADGIDSNGDFYLEGGEIYISGPTRHAERIIDYNGIVICKHGDMIALGASNEVQDLGKYPMQNYIIVYYNNARPKERVYQVLDSADNTLMAFTPNKNYRVAIITSDKLRIGNTYKLISDEHELEVELKEKVTIVKQ